MAKQKFLRIIQTITWEKKFDPKSEEYEDLDKKDYLDLEFAEWPPVSAENRLIVDMYDLAEGRSDPDDMGYQNDGSDLKSEVVEREVEEEFDEDDYDEAFPEPTIDYGA